MKGKALAFWVWICAYLNCAGWTLSALYELNAAGYAIALLPGLVGALWWFKKNPPPLHPRRFFRRFRRPLPAVFLFLTALIWLGGLLYAPNNYDGLTYRLPRMLNWLAAGTWHWIPTFDERMNWSATGWEWLAMPLLALTHSDRGMFLINALGFGLLPGALFSVFRQLGMARRVAWTWMWLLPLAYGCATQAGGIGNDLPGVVFGLLSVHFGLRARRSGAVTDVWLTVLAAALLTGVKLSNLPLALPGLVAVWPALGRLPKHWLGSLAVAGLAVVISALPVMALNQMHTGSWTGDPQDAGKMQIKSPAAALLGNSVLVAKQAFMPPVLPSPRQVDDWIVQHLPATMRQLLQEKNPRILGDRLNELPNEEGAGLGLGVTLLLLGGVGATLVGLGSGKFRPTVRDIPKLFPAVVLAAWISAAVYLLKMGSESGARLLLPYYALTLVPLLLLPGQRWLLKFRAWRFFMALMGLSVLPALVLSASRPLWPARFVGERLAHAHPGNPLLQRMASTYDAYAHRNDLLAPLRDHLPAAARDIGFLTVGNDLDYSLWRPFGLRRVIYLRQDLPHFLEHPGQTKWLVVKAGEWPGISRVPLAEWAAAHQFRMVVSTNLVERVVFGSETWCLLHQEP